MTESNTVQPLKGYLFLVMFCIFAGRLHAEATIERGPADAYGGGNMGGQVATPAQAKEVYRIPVEMPFQYSAVFKITQ